MKSLYSLETLILDTGIIIESLQAAGKTLLDIQKLIKCVIKGIRKGQQSLRDLMLINYYYLFKLRTLLGK